MINLGLNESIRIRESEEDGPYFILWPANTVSGQAYAGNYYEVIIKATDRGFRAFVPARPDWTVEAGTRDDVKEKLASYIKASLRQEEELILHYVERDPRRPGEDAARIKGDGTAIWAIIGHLEGAGGDMQQTAADYELPEEAIEAAKAYYARHKAAIDARRAANRVPNAV